MFDEHQHLCKLKCKMQPIKDVSVSVLWRALTKAKGPPGPKIKEDKIKGDAMFGRKPQTPKMIKLFAMLRKGSAAKVK